MSQPFFSAEARINENTFRILSRLLVAAMLACGAQTLVGLVERLLEGWNPWYLTPTAFVVALACLYYYPILRKLEPLGREWLLRLASFWLVVFVLLRLVIGLSSGTAAFLAEMARWPQDVSLILSGEFFLAAMVAVFTWFLADLFAEMLARLDLDAVRLQHELPDPVEAGKPPAREQLLTQTITIGVGLIALTALQRLDLRAAAQSELVIQQVPALAGGGASTLLYFLFGLALFSLAQFMDLQSRWGLNKIQVSGSLAGRWAQYSLFFLLVLAAIVSILPTNYSLGFIYILGYGLNILLQVAFFLLQLVLTLFALIINGLLSLFGEEPVIEQPDVPDMSMSDFMPNDGQAPLEITATPAWMETLRQAFFWGALLLVIFFAVRQLLYYNTDLLEALRRFRLVALLETLWGNFSGFFRKAGESLSKNLQAGIERIRSGRTMRQAVGGWINLRRLDPRQRVYFFYQAFLRRSGESGLPRSLSQTPSEFAQRLDSALPEAEPDIDALTAAFIEARYTRREIAPQSASLAQRTWQRLRQALRNRNNQISGK